MKNHLAMMLIGASALTFVSGCSGEPKELSETCVSWADLATPQDQFDESDLVLIGTPISTSGTVTAFGAEAQTHLVEVSEVLKGRRVGPLIRVSSMPETCTGSGNYPNGDPLETEERIIIFANLLDGEWLTATPFKGTLPYAPDEPLPFD